MGAANVLHEKARAKINLTLHVGPVRDDGYHPLQSLVVFAGIGDELSAEFSETTDQRSLGFEGPFGPELVDSGSNIIFPAIDIVDNQRAMGARIKLTKNLPIASGIGGGSADAAAAIRLVCKYKKLSPEMFSDEAADLGSDIPVCLRSRTSLMFGRGENLSDLPGRGQVHAVLVNPGVNLSTAKVFKAFDQNDFPKSDLSTPDTSVDLIEMSKSGRNDLQSPAIKLCPEIKTVLESIEEQPDCQLARMSGSGATCFGIFSSAESSQRAHQEISARFPKWWCVSTVLGELK